MRVTVHKRKPLSPTDSGRAEDSLPTSGDWLGAPKLGFQPAPGLIGDLPLEQSGQDRRGLPGRAPDPLGGEPSTDGTTRRVAPQLRRSFNPAGGGTIRREPFAALETYQRAASDAGKAPANATREPVQGATPGSVGQLAGQFASGPPAPVRAARDDIVGATEGSVRGQAKKLSSAAEPVRTAREMVVGSADGSVGRAAPPKTDRQLASLIHEAKDDWVTVKERYGSSVATMTELVNYRKRFVDGLIERLRSDKRFASMATRAAGSTALTSDYDITFLGVVGAEAVEEFNKQFRAHWGKEAGTVFDTNVYAEDVLPPKEQVLGRKDDISLLGNTSGPSNVDARLDEGLQDVSSLVKVRKNMKQGDWFTFVDTILQALRPDRAATAEAASRFADANTTFERTLVPQILQEIEDATNADGSKPGKEQLAKLRKQGFTTNVALVEAIMKVDEGIAGSNRVYESKLLYAAELEARRNLVDRVKKPREWNSLTVDLRKAKADAMLFANEPYFSAGTLYHVVGNVQAKFGATLSSAAYFQSMQENYGDTLKELHHLHGKEWQVIAIKASKYVWRTLDAACQMESAGVTVSGGLDLGMLRDAMKKALDVRQGVPGVTTDQALDALKTAKVASEDQLKAVLSKIVITANTVFRGGKTPEVKAAQGSGSESDKT